MKYGLSSIHTVIKDPGIALREFNYLYHSRLGKYEYNPSGINVFAEDWDNLIILDACRFDVFKDIHDLPGTLERRTSRGAMSKEFIIGNFSEKRLHDTVYISSNGWYAKLCKQIDAEVHDFVFIEGDEYPDKAERTNERALRAVEEYPNKRLIVHHMLPHLPFVGPTAKEKLPAPQAQRDRLYKDFRNGTSELTDEVLRQVYVENLEIVLPMVAELFQAMSGKTVVTADHGELLGDQVYPIPYKGYGHPSQLWVPELVEVPWLIHEDGTKAKIIPEPPNEDNLTGIESENISSHLKDLGYLL